MQLSVPVRTLTKCLLIIPILLATACGTAPKREPYAGPDTVGEINSDALVGSWQVSVLNPISNENDNEIFYTFTADGGFSSVLIIGGEQAETLGPMRFEGEGNWRTQGDQFLASTDNVEEVTGNSYGKFMQAVIGVFAGKEGIANPYEITNDRVVWVYEDTGAAFALVRQ